MTLTAVGNRLIVASEDAQALALVQELVHNQPLLGCRFDPSGRFVFAARRTAAPYRFPGDRDVRSTGPLTDTAATMRSATRTGALTDATPFSRSSTLSNHRPLPSRRALAADPSVIGSAAPTGTMVRRLWGDSSDTTHTRTSPWGT